MRFLAPAGLVMILSGLGAYYAVDRLSAFSIVNLVAGPVLLALAAVARGRSLRAADSPARALMLRWALTLAVVAGFVVALNVAASRWSAYLDLTPETRYTLSDQTVGLCAQVAPADGLRLLLFEDARLARDVRFLLAAYGASCPLEIRELRVAEAPPEARAVAEAYETTVVACSARRCEAVGFPSEENITNALLRLVARAPRRAYFAVGHGEVDLASDAGHGFSGLTAALRDEGIDVRPLVAGATAEIPGDASLVISAAPRRNLLEPELAALDRYLARGGRLLALLEPDADSNLDALLERWGFDLPAGVVADARSSPLLETPRPVTLLVGAFNGTHPVTRKLTARTLVLAPTARAVLPARKPEPADRLEGLAFASRRSWLESGVEGALADRPIGRDPGELGGRELPVAAMGRYPRGDAGAEARIVVIGDTDFASNDWLRALYNRDLALNAVLWLAESEERIAVRPKAWTPYAHPLTLETTFAYFYFLAFAVPEALLLLGLLAWYRQRG